MTNFNQMRNNMILGQFLPGLIKNDKILKYFNEIPREKFLPDFCQSVAYSDLNIKISHQRYIPSPFNTAKIFQEANFLGEEVLLVIGANYGYEVTVASNMVDTVIAIEEDLSIKEEADKNLKSFNIENIILINNKHEKGYKKLGPYDTIINLEPMYKVNQDLLEQLVDGGKLFYCEKQNSEVSESKLNVFYKKNNSYIKQRLFDLNIPSNINYNFNETHFDFS